MRPEHFGQKKRNASLRLQPDRTLSPGGGGGGGLVGGCWWWCRWKESFMVLSEQLLCSLSENRTGLAGKMGYKSC